MNYTPHHIYVSTFLIVYVCVFTLFAVCSYVGNRYWFSVSTEVSNLPLPNGRGENVVVSIVQKCEALQTLDNVETTQKLAGKCGVGGVTVGDWKRIKLTKLKNGIYRAIQWSP